MDIKRFSNRIKMERNNQKMSQKKLAEIVGMDNTALSRIENGEREISVQHLLKIADALNVSVDYLLLDYIPDDYYSDSDCLWKQISKLESEQKKILLDIIFILTQNNEQWRDTEPRNTTSLEDNKAVNYFEIGKRIRGQRLENKMSQEKLAELAGISTSFLGSIERGEEILSIETLFKIANALHQPVSLLLLNADRNNPILGLHDTVEALSRSDGNKSALLLYLLTTLLDNSNAWYFPSI